MFSCCKIGFLYILILVLYWIYGLHIFFSYSMYFYSLLFSVSFIVWKPLHIKSILCGDMQFSLNQLLKRLTFSVNWDVWVYFGIIYIVLPFDTSFLFCCHPVFISIALLHILKFITIMFTTLFLFCKFPLLFVIFCSAREVLRFFSISANIDIGDW